MKNIYLFFNRILGVESFAILLFFALLFAGKESNGQAFGVTYDFANVTTSSGTTDPTPPPTATGVTFGSFSAAGVAPNPNAATRFSFTGWSTGATHGSNTFSGNIDLSDYYQVTITPLAGYSIDINTIEFRMQRSGTGTRQYSVRSSIGGYAANLPASINPANTDLTVVATNIFQVNDASSSAEDGSTITLGATFDGLSSAVTFRFYGWNAEAAGGSFGIDNVIINGVANVSCTPPAAPTGSSPQSFCSGATVASLSATGSSIQWYDASSGGNLLIGSTALVNGTHYYASQTVSGCESTSRLDVTAQVYTSTTSIAPVATQTIPPSTNGTMLTITTGTATVTSTEWKYATTSGGPYSSFSPTETGSTYTPNFAAVNTYFVVAEVTYAAPCATTITSNEVQINVTSSYISNNNGSWFTPATWLPVGVPGPTDDVIINHAVTSNAAITRNAGTTTLVNAGHSLAVDATFTNNGTTTINGTFQLNTGGYANGANWFVYAATGSYLIFNSAGTYGVTPGQRFWPATNFPFNVTLNTGCGANLNDGARTINGTLTLYAGYVNTAGTTINGTLQMRNGGFVSANSPTYGAASLLWYYCTNTTYNNGLEWTPSAAPTNVQLSSNTTLNYPAITGARTITGNLIVDGGSSLYMDFGSVDCGGALTVGGNVTINGNLSLGTVFNRDLKTSGNLTFGSGYSFTPNNRAVWFEKPSGTQIITTPASADLTIPYIVVGAASGSGTTLQMGQNLFITAPLAGNAISFTTANDIININNRRITIGSNAIANMVSGNGTFRGSTSSNMTLLGDGDIGTIRFTPTYQTLANLTLNRTAANAGAALGTDLTINNSVTLQSGLLSLGTNNLTLNASATVNGNTPTATNMVVADGSGEMRKIFNAAGSFTFPIGDNTAPNGAQYSPATLSFTSGVGFSTSTYGGVRVTDLVHPNNNIAANYITRYWSTSTNLPTYNCNASFTYTDADIVGASEAEMISARWDGALWNPGNLVNAATNTISFNALTALLIDFTAGDQFSPMPLWTNPITGTNPNTANPYTTGDIYNPHISVSGITRGSGIASSNANDRYNANGWSTTSMNTNDYFEFTLTPGTGKKINFVSFIYTGQNSGTGPVNFAFRGSADGFSNNIGTATLLGTTISLSGADYQNITAPITFRFYAWGGTGGTYSINDFTFNGTVANIVGDYTFAADHFRSIASGNWGNRANWQSSHNNILWIAATAAPSKSASSVVIQNTHSIQLTHNPGLSNVALAGSLIMLSGYISTGPFASNTYSGIIDLADGAGYSLDIASGAKLQVVSTEATYTFGVLYNSSGNINVQTGGMISIGDGINTHAVGGYSNIGSEVTSKVNWNHGAILDWNSTGVNGLTTNGITYFPDANASTIPLLRISQTQGGTWGSAGTTIINGLTAINARNTLAASGSVTFRDGICGSDSLTFNITGAGTLHIDGAAPILGGSNLRILTNKVINIDNGITVPADSVVKVYGSVVNLLVFQNKGSNNFTVNGTANLTTTTISNTGGAVIINGKLITAHAGGLEATATSGGGTVTTTGSTTYVNENSTVEYNAASGNQNITGSTVLETQTGGDLANYHPYYKIIFSGGGTKTPLNVVRVDTTNKSSVTITGTPLVDFTSYNLGDTSPVNITPFIMDGGRLKLGTTGSGYALPWMNGNYNLTAGVVEFSNINATRQTIKGEANHAYYDVEVTGNNVGQSNGNINIKNNFSILANAVLHMSNRSIVQAAAGTQTFRMYSGSRLLTANDLGFHGPLSGLNAPTVKSPDIDNVTLDANSTIDYNRSNFYLGNPNGNQTITTTIPYQHLILSGDGNKTPALSSTLEVKGNFLKGGNPTAKFIHNDGTVLLSGTAKQIYADSSVSKDVIELNNFTTSNNTPLAADSISIRNSIGIHKKMLFSAVSTKLLLDSGNIIIRSSATSTGWIAAIPTGVTINYDKGLTNNNRGRFIVERYNYNARKWRFLSIPLTTSQTINEAWQEADQTGTGNPVSGYGTRIGSLYSNWNSSNWFDMNTPGGHDMKYWSNDANQRYNTISKTDTAIATGTGWMKFVRGDRSVVSTTGSSATILRTRGTLKRNAQSVSFTATATNQFFSAGNPYASAVDLRQITPSGVAFAGDAKVKFFWVWDPRLTNAANGGAYGLGAFQLFTLNGAGTDYTIFPGSNGMPGDPYNTNGSIDNNIESGTAFYVQSKAAGAGSVSFSEGSKTDGSREVFRMKTQDVRLMNILEAVTPDGPATMDGVLIDFNNNNSNAVNGDDALKITNPGENLSIDKSDKQLMFESKLTIQKADTIFLKISGLKARPYRFNLQPINMAKPGLQAWLIDKFTETATSIDLAAGSIYNFEISNNATAAADRFMIVFKQIKKVRFIGINANRNANKSVTVNWKTADEEDVLNYEVEKSTDGENFAVVKNTNPGMAYIFDDERAEQGAITYRIKAIHTDGSILYSNVEKVGALPSEISIKATPNPVYDNIIKIQFCNQPLGKYQMQMMNQAGQIVLTKEVSINSYLQIIEIPAMAFANGIYQMHFIDKNKKSQMLKLSLLK